MFELFTMSLREYWNETEDGEAEHSVEELQDVLSEHYECEVRWDEPEVDSDDQDEVSVDVIEDKQFAALQAVAAKIEVDGKLDGLEIDPEEPWDSKVFDQLAEKLDADDASGDPERFPHILSIGNSFECVCVPNDLPFVAQLNVGKDEDEECECDHHECDHDDDECCCCCDEDEETMDVSSVVALKREIDDLGQILNLDPNVNIDEDDSDSLVDADDPYRYAKVCWYIFNAKLKDALKAKLPMFMRYCDDDYDDMDDDDDVE